MNLVMTGRRSPVEMATRVGAVPLFCSFGPGFEPALTENGLRMKVGTGALFHTAAEAQDKGDRLDVAVRSLDKEIRATYKGAVPVGGMVEGLSGTVPGVGPKEAQFSLDWGAFEMRWRDFYDHWDSTYGGHWDTIDAFESEYDALRSRFRTLIGHEPDSADRVKDSDIAASHPQDQGGIGDSLQTIMTAITYVAIGAAVIGGVILVSNLSRASAA
jgi:hypothetical protein